MKSISLCLMVICTVVLAAQQSQAKKGCNAYGHACYGGHGKRSLGAYVNGGSSGNELDDVRTDPLLQMYPNDGSNNMLGDGDSLDAYPRYRMIKIMKSLLNNHPRRPLVNDHLNEMDYSFESSNTV